jgi:hypothetical protein
VILSSFMATTDSSCGIGAQRFHVRIKENALRAVLRPGGRLVLYCAFDCAVRWAGGYFHPGFTTPTSRSLLLPSFDHPRDYSGGRL